MATLVWFRQDLRLSDNPALREALSTGDIVPIYILDTVNAGQWSLGAASRWWLHHSLTALNASLDGHLQCFCGDPRTVIPQLVQQWSIDRVVWNRCYEPWRIQRDTALRQSLTEQGIEVDSFNASLLWEPWQVCKQDGSPYKVFTPYYRKGCLASGSPGQPGARPREWRFASVARAGVSIEALQLLPTNGWDARFYDHWSPGEAGAGDRLQTFLAEALDRYREGRDYPGITLTSRLSPHLHFGEISPRQVWHAALHARKGDLGDDNLDGFLSELGWREFSYYLLYHFPGLPERNYQAKFDQFPWRRDRGLLEAWQRGQTGIPIVDAGMRELWQTGFMHNRVRMIVASFLVKNLNQHWRDGEEWFWDCLLDADLASNSASWQWVAGSGADAAPYFRIFNPVTQGQKFDAGGEYVRRFCPELAQLPQKWIHQPWAAPEAVLREARVELGQSYPHPLVDLKQSRQRALDAFSALRAATV